MPNIFNADNGAISGSAGIKLSSDTSGVLNIQTNGTTAISISASQVVSFPATSGFSFAGQVTFAAGTAAAPSISVTGDTNTGIYFPGADQVAVSAGGVQRLLVDSVGTTLSTGVLTVPAGTVSAPSITTTGDSNTGIYFPAADTIAFTEGGVESARFDSAGNFGLGVTPSAWGSTFTSIDIDAVTSLACEANVTTVLGQNCYNNGGWKYRSTSGFGVSRYDQFGGAHYWHTAPSGTAGNAISFTQAMTLDASGNLGVGFTSPATKLHVGGSGNQFVRLETTSGAACDWITTSSDTYFGPRTNTALAFQTNNAERARITAGGALLVNTTSNSGANSVFNVNGTSVIGGNSALGSSYMFFTTAITFSAGTSTKFIQFTLSGSGMAINAELSLRGVFATFNADGGSKWAIAGGMNTTDTNVYGAGTTLMYSLGNVGTYYSVGALSKPTTTTFRIAIVGTSLPGADTVYVGLQIYGLGLNNITSVTII